MTTDKWAFSSQILLFFPVVFLLTLNVAAGETITFEDPTPPDGSAQIEDYAAINTTITASILTSFNFVFDSSDVSIYDNSLVASYPFNNVSSLGESNGIIKDIGLNGNNGTTNATLVAGYRGYGLAFNDNVGSYRVTGNITKGFTTAIDPMTIDFLIKPPAVMSQTATHRGIFGYKVTGKHSLFGCFQGTGAGDSRVTANRTACWIMSSSGSSGGSFDKVQTLTNTNDPNRWYHITVTIDDLEICLYVDGLQEDCDDRIYYPVLGSTNFTLGYARHDDFNTFFNGTLDEFRMYNRTFNSDEVLTLARGVLDRTNTTTWNYFFNATTLSANVHSYSINLINSSGGAEFSTTRYFFTVVPNTTLSFADPTPRKYLTTSLKTINFLVLMNISNARTINWHFDGTNNSYYSTDLVFHLGSNNNSLIGENNTKWIDTSFYNNTITSNNLPSIVTGKYGNGVHFDGLNDELVLAGHNKNIPGFNDSNSSANAFNPYDLTISAWIKTDKAVSNIQGGIVGKGRAASNVGYLFKVTTGGKLNFTVRSRLASTGVQSWDQVTGTTTLTDGVWYHVLATLNKTSLTRSIYINGVLEAQLNRSPSEIGDLFLVGTDSNFTVGSSRDANYFNGSIDEVYVYNRSFPDSMIQQLSFSRLTKTNLSSWEFSNHRTELTAQAYNYSIHIIDDFNRSISDNTRTFTIVNAPRLRQSYRNIGLGYNRELWFDPNIPGTLVNVSFSWIVNGSTHTTGKILFFDGFAANTTSYNTTFFQNNSPVWTVVDRDYDTWLYKNASVPGQLTLNTGNLPDNYVFQFTLRAGEYLSSMDNITIYLDYESPTKNTMLQFNKNADLIYNMNERRINNNTPEIQPAIGRFKTGAVGEYQAFYDNSFDDDGRNIFRFIKRGTVRQLQISRDGARWLNIIAYNDTRGLDSTGNIVLNFSTVEVWIDNVLLSTDMNYTLAPEILGTGANVSVTVNTNTSESILIKNPLLVHRYTHLNDLPAKIEMLPVSRDYGYANYTITLVNVVCSASFDVSVSYGDTSGYTLDYTHPCTAPGNQGNITIPIFDISEDKTGLQVTWIFGVTITGTPTYDAIEFYRTINTSIYADFPEYNPFIRTTYKYMKVGYLNLSDTLGYDDVHEGYHDMNADMRHHNHRGIVNKNDPTFYAEQKMLAAVSPFMNLSFEISRQEALLPRVGYNFANCNITTSTGLDDTDVMIAATLLWDLENTTNTLCYYNRIVSAGHYIYTYQFNSTTGSVNEDPADTLIGVDRKDLARIGLLFRAGNISNNATLTAAAILATDRIILNGLYNTTTQLFHPSGTWNGTAIISMSGAYDTSSAGMSRALFNYYLYTGNTTYWDYGNWSIHGFVNGGLMNKSIAGQWAYAITKPNEQYFDSASAVYAALYTYGKVTGATDLRKNETDTYNYLISNTTFLSTKTLNTGNGQFTTIIGAHLEWRLIDGASSRSLYDYSENSNYQSAESSKGVTYLFPTTERPYSYWINNTITNKTAVNASAGYNWIARGLSYNKIVWNGTLGYAQLRNSSGGDVFPQTGLALTQLNVTGSGNTRSIRSTLPGTATITFAIDTGGITPSTPKITYNNGSSVTPSYTYSGGVMTFDASPPPGLMGIEFVSVPGSSQSISITTTAYTATVVITSINATNASIVYSTSNPPSGNSYQTTSIATSYSLPITGLASGTVYYGNITLMDAGGNTAEQGLYQFTTLGITDEQDKFGVCTDNRQILGIIGLMIFGALALMVVQIRSGKDVKGLITLIAISAIGTFMIGVFYAALCG